MQDFYEFTMAYGYFKNGMKDRYAYFDIFFRKVPDGGSFVIANGVKKCAEYLLQFHFSHSDIQYLKSLNLFSQDYLDYLF